MFPHLFNTHAAQGSPPWTLVPVLRRKKRTHENLYTHQVRHFNAAVEGQGMPFATGEDGVSSLAVASAVLESTKNGLRIAVQY